MFRYQMKDRITICIADFSTGSCQKQLLNNLDRPDSAGDMQRCFRIENLVNWLPLFSYQLFN
jgi:hypothetical protein